MATTLPELLAPAGTAACALAAFDAGADAIYCGLAKFNARERGENFTPDTLGATIEYAHKLHRKVYVTFNTVIKENELAEVAENLGQLAELGPDALIIQDLGVWRLLREYFPMLPIHASTQMGFHNTPGLEVAKQLGAKRVILERQISFDELKHLQARTPLELEIFIHGALCCSLSGQCLFSSWCGGHSGNRGRCKQPCRRRYYSQDGNGFFFSPQDLCTIDLIPEIRKLNIASLKIEGRLRQPDYVYHTVEAYRLLLDAPDEAFADDKLLGKARNLLSKTCGRKWSHGFYDANGAQTVVAPNNLGASGMLIGTVAGVDDGGFAFETKKRLHLGDRLRVQPVSGDEGPAMTVTRMRCQGQFVTKAKPGDYVYILCDKAMPFKGLIYKIGESFSDYSARVAALAPARKLLNLNIDLTAQHIQVTVDNAAIEPWTQAVDLKNAEKHPVAAADLEQEFRASDSDTLGLGTLQCHIDGDYFLPGSVLKEIRRKFWSYIKQHLTAESVFLRAADGLTRFALDYRRLLPEYTLSGRTPEIVAVRPGGAMPAKKEAHIAVNVYDINKNAKVAILPEFTSENQLGSLQKAIQNAYDFGVRTFRVRSLFELQMLSEYPDLTLIAADPIPIANSMAAKELQQLGLAMVQAHLELEKTAIENLRDHSVLPVEVYRFGRPPILVTRAAIAASGDLKDARGNRFLVKSNRKSQLTRLYPGSILSIPHVNGTLDFYDLEYADWKNQDCTTFNFETELL